VIGDDLDGLLGDPAPTDLDTQSLRRPPKRRRTLPKILVLLVVVAVLLGGGIYAVGRIVGRIGGGSAADYPGPGSGTVVIKIDNGASATDIARILAVSDVVASERAFVNAAGADSRSRSIQPGFYRLSHQMSAAGALTALLDTKDHALFRMTIAEGETSKQIFQELADQTGLSVSDFQKAAATPAALGLPSYASTIEGYLWPSTYDLTPGASAAATLKMFVDRFKAETASLDIVGGGARLGQTPQGVITIASIIEREVKRPDEGPKVSRVIYNRLADRTGQFFRLDMDSTTRYALGGYEGPLSEAQLNVNSPYNTRVVRGLPPGAISNPGLWAISSALQPAPGTWLYFVSLPKSNYSIFATTEAEWKVAQAKYRSEGGH
jgi:UPF0755 protein